MLPTPEPNEVIDLKKMIEDIDMRFVSGNIIPVERAAVRAWEWTEIKRILNTIKGKKNVS